MFDRILAVAALVAVGLYFLPLIISVPAPALICVLVLVLLLAAFDFWRELRATESP
ncbi:MAG TPA: hypothetical protein VIR38_02900 [Thalassobaculum sp.]